ncbi:trypsin-like peptidase domain-containing protein [Streptomyces sp. NPDC005438]|uniref:S1C family serine protease n=1 Tax=Streptomyces sp. NPDC005438 TaxID=3156880 RepID=UPI0033A1C3E6
MDKGKTTGGEKPKWWNRSRRDTGPTSTPEAPGSPAPDDGTAQTTPPPERQQYPPTASPGADAPQGAAPQHTRPEGEPAPDPTVAPSQGARSDLAAPSEGAADHTGADATGDAAHDPGADRTEAVAHHTGADATGAAADHTGADATGNAPVGSRTAPGGGGADADPAREHRTVANSRETAGTSPTPPEAGPATPPPDEPPAAPSPAAAPQPGAAPPPARPEGAPATVPSEGADQSAPSEGAGRVGAPEAEPRSAPPETGPEATPSPSPGSTAEAGPPPDLTTPLHGEDPYGTPPYGGPGPWAPAPLVQHPSATPPRGVPTGATPAQGVPAQGGVPAQSAEVAPASAPPPGQPPPHPGTPAPGAAPLGPTPATVCATSAHESTPAHGATPAGGTPLPGPAQRAAHPQTAHPHGGPSAPVPAQGVPGDANWPHPYDPWADHPVAHTAPTRERSPRGRRLVLAALALTLVAGLAGGVVGVALERAGDLGGIHLEQPPADSKPPARGSVAAIAQSVLPGVVTLHVSGAKSQGTGTGFVLDDRGHILTNSHVVDAAKDGGQIRVTFQDGQSTQAKLVGHDSGYDLAVVKVDGVSGLRPLPLGNSEAVRVGDPVVAVGAPFDLAGTVTSGIISAKERPITAGGERDASDVSYVNALQTDAPINPGNSGGPLLDSGGRVIGINSVIRSADSGRTPGSGQGGSIGLGFAIPVNQAKRVAEELISTGRATHPVIGVLLDMEYEGEGAKVGARKSDGPPVTPGGPGARAGLRKGDVITEVDGERVRDGEELIVRIRSHEPEDKLRLLVRRGGSEHTVTVTLGASSEE